MILTPIKQAPASSNDFIIGLCIDISHNTTASDYTLVTLTPCLLLQSKTIHIEQSAWDVSFVVDDIVQVFSYHGTCWDTGEVDRNYYLPNDDTQQGVTTAYGLQMQSNKWYQWGNAFTVMLKNDGSKHYVGVRLQCLEAEPANCPFPETFLTYDINTPQYIVNPTPPTELSCTYNENRTVLLFNWDWNDTIKTCVLHIREYDKNNNKVAEYVSSSLSQDNRPFGRSTKYLHTDTVKIEWWLKTISATRHTADSEHMTTEVDVIPKVWKKIDGVWKKTIPWVKVDGVWLRATQAHIKTQSGWKTTIK